MQTDEVSFEFPHHQIVLSVSLNGHGPFQLLLDSGTDPSVIDRQLTRQLNLRVLPLIKLTRVATIQVGNVVSRNVLALALDLASLSKRLGQPLHGVLGHSFLKSLAVRIDYSARRIWFTDTAQVPATIPSRSPHQHLRAPLKLWDNFPILDGCLVNGQPLRLTLDTGSSAGLTLFPEAVQFLGLSETAHTGKSGTSLGYRGEEQSTLGQVRLLELGTIRLTDVETRFVVSGDRAKTPLKRRDGNIGNALLQDFALTLDYLNQTIILEQPQR